VLLRVAHFNPFRLSAAVADLLRARGGCYAAISGASGMPMEQGSGGGEQKEGEVTVVKTALIP
jgi:hypothetical protein